MGYLPLSLVLVAVTYLAWDSYVCEIPEDAEVSTMSYSFDPADYRELYFHLDEGINCTNVEVDIIFPRRLFSYDLLQLESHFKGNVQVRLDDRDTATTVIKSLEILAKEGNVGVRDVVVTRAMNIVARSGAVEGKAEVERVVRVSASKGVDLELESRTNTMEVKVNSNRHAQVTMLFARCCFYQQKVNNNTLIGFVSYTGYEPGYLPRIDIKGDTARLDLLA
ncbi:hypothetical protein BGX33_005274 [Mortierella sp. NVP41]|nr:hypothetical protein BGX33_005274 [Mortierella sp. NVP41]